MLDFDRFQVVSFDCYGTLIDWEEGIVRALRPVLSAHRIALSDEEILTRYGSLESSAEAGSFKPYKAILGHIVEELAAHLHFEPTPTERQCLVASLASWPPFPDTVEALRALGRRFKLAVISNIDDDLFSHSARLLEVPFDWVITAEQVRSYKPARRNFTHALRRIGVPGERLLHVAQSLYHDIAPATQLGLTSVWVNRRQGRTGPGATPSAQAQPALEVPDLRTLVEIIGIE
jgi:2-haloacid dehalogenase